MTAPMVKRLLALVVGLVLWSVTRSAEAQTGDSLVVQRDELTDQLSTFYLTYDPQWGLLIGCQQNGLLGLMITNSGPGIFDYDTQTERIAVLVRFGNAPAEAQDWTKGSTADAMWLLGDDAARFAWRWIESGVVLLRPRLYERGDPTWRIKLLHVKKLQAALAACGIQK